MRTYLVTYLSNDYKHERFRCRAESKGAAKKKCIEYMGYLCEKVIKVEEEVK